MGRLIMLFLLFSVLFYTESKMRQKHYIWYML